MMKATSNSITNTLSRQNLKSCIRLVSAVSGKENYNFKELNCWRFLPNIIPFQLTEKQAKEKFENWQRAHWFAPSNVLETPDVEICSAFMPFWCFEAKISYDYTTRPGFKTGQGKITWSKIKISDSMSDIEIKSDSPHMQIYASFKHRRDLTEVLKQGNSVDVIRPLTVKEAKESRVKVDENGMSWTLESPEMQQAMAWELALRALRKSKEKEIENLIKKKTGADEIEETHINFKIIKKKAKMIYYPAYVLKYSFSKSYAPNGAIVPDRFEAILSGLSSGGIAGERHFCPLKVQWATLGAGISCCLGSAALGQTIHSAILIDTLFWTFIFSMMTRFLARFVPKIKKYEHLKNIESFDEKFERNYFKEFNNMSDKRVFTDYQDILRCDAEWFHWEEVDKWEWDAYHRQKWGQMLWHEQVRRRQENIELKEKLKNQKIKMEREMEREERRRLKYGESERQKAFSERIRLNFHPSKKSDITRKKDILGYYSILGLDTNGKVTEEEIKIAFKKKALLWHPDLRVINAKTRDVDPKEMHKMFQDIQTAYEILRDPKQKRRYDSGMPIYEHHH